MSDQKYRVLQMSYQCPEDFEPVCYLITALDKHGRPFTMAPIEQPEVALVLAAEVIGFVNRIVAAKQQGLTDDKRYAEGSFPHNCGTA